jgi:hypothetical protein
MRKDMRAMLALAQAKATKAVAINQPWPCKNSTRLQTLAWMAKTARNYPFGGLAKALTQSNALAYDA